MIAASVFLYVISLFAVSSSRIELETSIKCATLHHNDIAKRQTARTTRAVHGSHWEPRWDSNPRPFCLIPPASAGILADYLNSSASESDHRRGLMVALKICTSTSAKSNVLLYTMQQYILQYFFPDKTVSSFLFPTYDQPNMTPNSTAQMRNSPIVKKPTSGFCVRRKRLDIRAI